MEQHKSQMKSKNATITLIIIGIMIVIGIVVSLGSWRQGENLYLKVDKEILTFDPLKNTQIEVVGNQVVKVTQDGITAYNFDGEEVWADTLTLDSIVLQQRGNYIAVSSKNGRSIHVFNEKGRQGQITLQHPIISFSINQNGQLAIIEQLAESYQISAYNENGDWLGVTRVTYTKTKGYPMAAEVSPDGSLLLASYVDMNQPKITSVIEAIPVQKPTQQKVDQVKYGIKEQNNLVYEIEFISNDIWASIGDTGTTLYHIAEGKEIAHLSNTYPTYIPYINSLPRSGGYLPMVVGEMATGTSIHNKEKIMIFDVQGQVVLEQSVDNAVTYYYADQKGVIIGEGRHYQGYNKMGVKQFEFKATQDVMRLVYKGPKAIAVTKDKVLLLKEEMREEN
ncbi:MAG: DUF5711 family protein [Cellulosilyticaceae bacterium]